MANNDGIEYLHPGALALCKLEEAMHPRPDLHTVGLMRIGLTGSFMDSAANPLRDLASILTERPTTTPKLDELVV